MYSATFVIITAIISALVGAYYYGRQVRRKVQRQLTQEHQRNLTEQLELFDDTTSQLLSTAHDYANFHSENASQAIQILDTHLEETGTTLSPEYAAVLEEIRYSYSYSTVH